MRCVRKKLERCGVFELRVQRLDEELMRVESLKPRMELMSELVELVELEWLVLVECRRR